MDPFLAIVLGSVALVLGAFVVLGILTTPGTGSEQLGWRTTHEHDRTQAVRDAEDLEQMLEAANMRRRARGERELTLDGIGHGGPPPQATWPAPAPLDDEDVRRGLM